MNNGWYATLALLVSVASLEIRRNQNKNFNPVTDRVTSNHGQFSGVGKSFGRR